MSLKSRFKSFIHQVAFYSHASSVMARRQGCRRIIMFHGIEKNRADSFHKQIDYLNRYFKIVPLGTLIETAKINDSANTSNEIALTFDDGLRNNVTVVYPILRKFEAPATFFVCPGLIESGKWLWNHEVRCRMRSLAPSDLTLLLEKLSANTDTIEATVEWMKTLCRHKRKNAEELIRDATPRFRPTPEQEGAYNIMNWDELAFLDPQLITIGSHTRTHPILTTLPEDEAKAELLESRHCLGVKLQRPVDFFCYPNGSYNEHIYRAVKNIYRAAVTVESGTLSTDKFDPHKMPRIPGADNAILTAWRLHRPFA